MEKRSVRDNAAELNEVESVVYRPGSWLVFSVGLLFLCGGIWIYISAGGKFPPPWPLTIFALSFAGLGAIAMLAGLKTLLIPQRVKHSPLNILPGVPTEPLICQGVVSHMQLTHELVIAEGGWELRPNTKLWRSQKWLLTGLGIFCLIFFSAILSWVFHREGNLTWPVAILLAALVAYVGVGVTLGLIAEMTRAEHKRLTTLVYAATRNELILDSLRAPNKECEVIHAALAWSFAGDGKRQQLAIPRELVAAVQLCPWKRAVAPLSEESDSWSVQGLLVLMPDESGACHRLPLLVTNDHLGAARLMRRLALAIEVPFLFCADADGWAKEEARAQARGPLKTGRRQT